MACLLLPLDLGFVGFRLAWGRAPRLHGRQSPGLGEQLPGEVWAQSPWLPAAPLRLLNLLLTAGKQGGRRRRLFLLWGPDAALLSFPTSAFALVPFPCPLPRLPGQGETLTWKLVVFL